MKTTSSISALFACVAILSTQAVAVPDLVTYAARVENDAGPFTGTASVSFQLFNAATEGAELWSENAASIVVLGGDLVHELGSIEPLDDDLFDGDDVFLQVTINGDTLEPRAAIRAVPFALRAKDADTSLLADRALSADNATTLAGQPAASFQFSAGAGGGLALAGNAFSIADNAVTSARIADGAVGTADVAAGAITQEKLASAAVGAAQLSASAVGAAAIANNAVLSIKIADGAVTSTKLADDAVSAAKLATNAVTEGAIATNAVTGAKIANDAVTIGKLSGGSTRVGERPAGCGGGLQPMQTVTTGSLPNGCVGGLGFQGSTPACSVSFPCTCGSCKASICGTVEFGSPRFFNCAGTSCVSPTASTCPAATFVRADAGRLVFAP
jgi:hypothetical protein